MIKPVAFRSPRFRGFCVAQHVVELCREGWVRTIPSSHRTKIRTRRSPNEIPCLQLVVVPTSSDFNLAVVYVILIYLMSSSLILFGAGASYGSDTSSTPPLGADLFDQLARFNPDGWGKIAPDLAVTFRADFERGMTGLADQNPHALPPLQRAMAAYFFRFQPRNTNLYFKLAQLIHRSGWTGTIATLNYERLLEISLLASQLRVVVGNDPDQTPGVELILPHGCCHLFCDSVRGAAGFVSFAGMNVTTNGPVRAIADPNEFLQRLGSDAFPPVMSYFEPAKHTTAGANFIQAQRARWAHTGSRADQIAIVGVRVRPGDSHIWDPLKQSPARLIYCGGTTGATEFQSWAATHRAGRGDISLSGYFREEFAGLCDYLRIR